jgi:hypothetical protein
MTIIDLMCPLFNAGVHPKQFADIVLELASKNITKGTCIKSKIPNVNKIMDFKLNIRKVRCSVNSMHQEQDTKCKQDNGFQTEYKKGQMFSEFKDKDGYSAILPSGKYLAHVSKL